MHIDTPARLLRLLVLFSSRSSWSATESDGPAGGHAAHPAAGRDTPAGPRVPDREHHRALRRLRPRRGRAAAAAAARRRRGDRRVRRSARAVPDRRSDARRGRRGGDDQARPGHAERPARARRHVRRGDRAHRPGRAVRSGRRAGDGHHRSSWRSPKPVAARSGCASTTAPARAAAGRRHVEPHRLVSLRNRWYLVAFDLDRDDWRTFRIDRIGPPAETGLPQRRRATAPDAAALVAEGVAVRAYELQARIRLPVPPAVAAREIAPTIGVIETTDADAQHRRRHRRRRRLDRPLPGRPAVPVRDPRLRRGPPRGRAAGPPAARRTGALTRGDQSQVSRRGRARTPTASRWTTRRSRRRTVRRRRTAAPRCAGCRGTGAMSRRERSEAGGGRRRSAPGRGRRRARPGRTGTER